MDISLEQPCDFLFAPLDKQYQYVKFSPPTKICPIERLSNSESDSDVISTDLDQNSDDEIDEHEKASNILLDIYELMPGHRDSEKMTEQVTEENEKSEKLKIQDSEKNIEKSNRREGTV